MRKTLGDWLVEKRLVHPFTTWIDWKQLVKDILTGEVFKE